MNDTNKSPVGTVVRRQMMTNSIRVVIDFEPTEDLRLAQMFPQGQSVVVASITAEAAKDATTEAFITKEEQPEPPAEKVAEKGPHGTLWQNICQRGWLNSEEVRKVAFAGDAESVKRALKQYFDVSSLSFISARDIAEWAHERGIFYTLPPEVKNAK